MRDERRVEDIRKVDGDDPADAARYGLVSGGRIAGVGAWPARLGGHIQPGATQESPNFGGSASGATGPHGVVGARFNASQPGNPSAIFVTGMPLEEQIKRQISATDPTSVAIQSQRLEGEAKKQLRPKPLPRRR